MKWNNNKKAYLCASFKHNINSISTWPDAVTLQHNSLGQ